MTAVARWAVRGGRGDKRPTTQLRRCAASWVIRLDAPRSLASCRSRSVMGRIHSHWTGSPAKVNPDRSGTSGPISWPGSSSRSTPSFPPPSGNVAGSWYQRML